MFYGSQASICLTHLGRSKGLYRYPDLQIDYTRNSEKAILTHGHNIRKGKTTELQSIVKELYICWMDSVLVLGRALSIQPLISVLKVFQGF